jgi:hypothetical protein
VQSRLSANARSFGWNFTAKNISDYGALGSLNRFLIAEYFPRSRIQNDCAVHRESCLAGTFVRLQSKSGEAQRKLFGVCAVSSWIDKKICGDLNAPADRRKDTLCASNKN